MSIPIERVVALATPTIFAPVAALLTKWITVNIPGSHISAGDITALQVTAFTGAVAMAAHWLHGRQLEQRAIGVIDKLPAPVKSEIETLVNGILQDYAGKQTFPLPVVTGTTSGVLVSNAANVSGTATSFTLGGVPSDEQEFADVPPAPAPPPEIPESARTPDGPPVVPPAGE